MMRRDFSAVVGAIVVGLSTVTACSDTAEVTTPTSLEVTPISITLNPGASQTISARVLDQNGVVIPDIAIQYSASDVAVATVDGGGLVTAVGPGTEAITVTALSFTATVSVTVTGSTAATGSISLTPDSTTLIPATSATLSVTVLDSAGNPVPSPSVQFTSGNTGVVTVSAGGILTGVAVGTTTVTATSAGISASVSITVAEQARVESTGSPFGIDATDSGVVYVTKIGGNGVGRLDLPFLSIDTEFPVSGTPAHLAFAPGGQKAYVTIQTGQALAELDVASNTETRRLALGDDGFNLVVSRDGNTVYTTTGGGKVFFVDAATLAKSDSVQLGPVTNGLVEHPTASLLYVSSRDAGTLTEINTTTRTIVRTFNIGGMPQRVVITPDGNTVFVANEVNGIDVIDLVAGTVLSPINLGGDGLGLAITGDGQTLYVSMPLTRLVKAVDVATRTVVTTLSVGGVPRNITITGDDAIALIANQNGWIDLLATR